MRLHLVRHAPAIARGVLRRDAARPLTPQGRRRFEDEVRALARLGVRLDVVLHSPWLRAVETADLLAPLVRSGRRSAGRFAVTPLLARRPTRALLAEIRGRTVAVVGHEPWLSALAAWLVTGRRDEAPRFALKKGGVLVLDGEPAPGAMRIAAAYPPATLRRLGR